MKNISLQERVDNLTANPEELAELIELLTFEIEELEDELEKAEGDVRELQDELIDLENEKTGLDNAISTLECEEDYGVLCEGNFKKFTSLEDIYKLEHFMKVFNNYSSTQIEELLP